MLTITDEQLTAAANYLAPWIEEMNVDAIKSPHDCTFHLSRERKESLGSSPHRVNGMCHALWQLREVPKLVAAGDRDGAVLMLGQALGILWHEEGGLVVQDWLEKWLKKRQAALAPTV